jgi:hypothetical protein
MTRKPRFDLSGDLYKARTVAAILMERLEGSTADAGDVGHAQPGRSWTSSRTPYDGSKLSQVDRRIRQRSCAPSVCRPDRQRNPFDAELSTRYRQ